MKGDLLINGQDAYELGIAMGDGFIGALQSPSAVKGYIENDDPTKDGKEILLHTMEGESVIRVKDRALTLTFDIFGRTPKERNSRYNAFIAMLHKGLVTIQVPSESSDIYRLYYSGTSGSYMLSPCRTTSKLTVKFNEPNPTNRGIE